MSFLELVCLKKQFGELVAVRDIDLSIDEFEIRGLIGPNGSGKTTTFNLITGFLRPTHGMIKWQGHDISRKSSHHIARLGLVRTFQISKLFSDMTAIQNVIIACHLHTEIGLVNQFLRGKKTLNKEKDVEKQALHLLETMDIFDTKDEIAGDLPHGYQRALEIAIALASKPKLLLLDEPVTGMNPVETQNMIEKIKKLRDDGITIFIVEHDMKAVMSCCDKITVMNFGQKIAEGLPKEIVNNKNVVEAYLGKEQDYA